MTRAELIFFIRQRKNFLCVGLDSDPAKLPPSVLSADDPVLEFNRQIIEATAQHCVAYKVNTAFYEMQGTEGWRRLHDTLDLIPSSHFTIADAKRGDIGNTSNAYAQAFFEKMNWDALTVNPYMGFDSVNPFIQVKNKWTVLLALTSNAGSKDFQMLKTGDEFLWEKVIEKSATWGTNENTMYVIGATHPGDFKKVRKLLPDHFLLVPGIGAQGGSMKEVCDAAFTSECGLLINASRSILFASSEGDYAEKAGEEARKIAAEMSAYF